MKCRNLKVLSGLDGSNIQFDFFRIEEAIKIASGRFIPVIKRSTSVDSRYSGEPSWNLDLLLSIISFRLMFTWVLLGRVVDRRQLKTTSSITLVVKLYVERPNNKSPPNDFF